MDFAPENELETVLKAAATDPEARPRFYEVLSSATLFLIDERPETRRPSGGDDVLREGESIPVRQLEFEGTLYVPVFSSKTRVGALVPDEVAVIGLAAKALFELIAGSHVVLNPGSAYGKQFTPDEIAQIVDGSIFEPRARTMVPEDRQVMLGQPSDYPKHVTDALAAFFKDKPEVAAAYLAHMFVPNSGEPPHTMIGVDAEPDADFDRLSGEVGIVLGDVAHQGELIDLIRITEGGVSDYMTQETTPFYKRA